METIDLKAELACLIERVAQRDKAAFEQLYRLTSRKMFAVALRIAREPGLAQDVLQDAYIRLWRYAHTFNAALSAPETWVHQIVRNRALDLLSQQSNTVNTIPIDSFSDSEDQHEQFMTESAAARSDQGDAGRLMNACMDRLDGKYRQVLTLAYNHGMSHGEISEHLDVPLGTVKTWARRGLIELKIVYDELEGQSLAQRQAGMGKPVRPDFETPTYYS